MGQYKIVVDGTVLDGFDEAHVKEEVARLFKLTDRPDKLEKLFSGKSVVAKRGQDHDSAERYVNTLRKAGLACHMELEEPIVVSAQSSNAVISPDSQDSSLFDSQQHSASSSGCELHRLGIAEGWHWVPQGFAYFKQQPWHWIGAVVVMMLIYMVLGMVPIMQLLSVIVTCLMTGGLMIACYKQMQGEHFSVAVLFDGFRYKLKPLALLGLLNLLVSIVGIILTVMVFLSMLGSLDGLQQMAEAGTAPDPIMGLILLLIIMLIWTPIIMMTWFAPALVTLNSQGPWSAMKLSFKGSLKNILPLSLFGLVMTLLAIVASIPLFLGWLVLLPMLYTTMFAAYRQIYCEA